jgi:hypothetical protein
MKTASGMRGRIFNLHIMEFNKNATDCTDFTDIEYILIRDNPWRFFSLFSGRRAELLPSSDEP